MFALFNHEVPKIAKEVQEQVKDFEFDVELDMDTNDFETFEMPEIFLGRYMHEQKFQRFFFNWSPITGLIEFWNLICLFSWQSGLHLFDNKSSTFRIKKIFEIFFWHSEDHLFRHQIILLAQNKDSAKHFRILSEIVVVENQ